MELCITRIPSYQNTPIASTIPHRNMTLARSCAPWQHENPCLTPLSMKHDQLPKFYHPKWLGDFLGDSEVCLYGLSTQQVKGG